ncbi:MAG: nodulation protein NfeD [Deltaproteobacteria bacterium]|nr:nodulation protein NfeD [Deltaproteobacteria bacterium]
MIRALALLVLLLSAVPASAFPVIEVEGPIGPVAAEHVAEALDPAAAHGQPLAVVRLDTPGGLDASMRRIVQAVLASPVPVVAWVGPSGARAASAGVFVVAAAHVAAMAPGTNLGAAHPVNLGGGGDQTSARKAEQDAAAFLRSLAQQRGRDAAWFEVAVTKSESLSAEEAVRRGVVDLLAPDLGSLAAALDGRTVSIKGHLIVLRTKGLSAEPVPLSFRQRVLQVLSDPNVAYLLMILGFYGLFFELANPGSVLPGAVGGLCLILAFVGLQTLPFHYGGILLILLGLVLFLLEVKVTSYGLLTVGGTASLVLGSLLLFKSQETYYRLSLGVLLPVVVVTVLFFLFAVGAGVAAQRGRPVSGVEGLVGQRGRVLDALGPGARGRVFVRGEYWNAQSEIALSTGDEVEVLGLDGMELRVGPVRDAAPEERS